MLRRILAAAIVLVIAALLLAVGWPTLFGISRVPGIAQAVSLRGLAVAAALSIVVLLGFIAVLSARSRRMAATFAVLLIAFSALNGVVIATRGAGSIAFETPGDSTLTVLSWNTLGDAPGAAAIAELAVQSNADIVSLAETSQQAGLEVAAAMGAAGHPMQAFTVSFDLISKARSTTLLVSTDLGEYTVDPAEPNSSVLPTVIARPVDGTGPMILAVHLVAPIPGEGGHWQSDLDWLSGACTGANVIMAGDFNSTLDHYAGLATKDGATIGECSDSASMTDNGAVGTWPTSLPALLGAPIDHIMQTDNWRVTGMRVIENYDKYGSDHRPILAQLAPSRSGQP